MSLKLIKEPKVDKELLSYEGVTKSFPFDKKTAVYFLNNQMFALILRKSSPLKLSLMCDSVLSDHLRIKYETVMPGERLNPKKWNTILLTGQLEWPEIRDLIRHAYELAKINF